MVIRVCIVGAGPSGMSALGMFKQLKGQGEPCEVTCYEKQDAPGGLWNLTWRTGLDEFGETVHCSMYRDLFSNGPKEALEFPEYTFMDHFGKEIPSCPPRPVLYDYLKGYWRFLGVEDGDVLVKHSVKKVKYDESRKTFTVAVKNLVKNEEYSQEFDRVIVAAGHFSTPHVPTFPGIETFDGRVLHAHDFRNAREFTGKNVLLIGASYSAEDIGLQLHKFGAKGVTMSWRTKPMGFAWPKTMKEVQLLTKVNSKTCYFKDGHVEDFDAIILCTGYRHNFPFMAQENRLEATNIFNLQNLYRNTQWYGTTPETKDTDGRLFYLGMTDQFYTYTMFMMQGLWSVQVIKGIHSVPSREKCVADIELRLKENEFLGEYNDQIDNQAEFMERLREDTKHPVCLKGCAEMFKGWEGDKHEDILTYRDKTHKNLFTGRVSPLLTVPWVKLLDDSLKTYLSLEYVEGKEEHMSRHITVNGVNGHITVNGVNGH